MRALMITLGLVAAAIAADMQASRAVAYPIYPWCAQYGGAFDGATNCYFVNLWQCQQTIAGMGGSCYQNPFFLAYGPDSEGPRPTARPSKRRTTHDR